MNLDALREQFIDLAERVAPDIIGPRPMYLCFRSELPEWSRSFFRGGGCNASYSPHFDCLMHDHLAGAGLWNGRGPCVYFDDNVLQGAIEPFATNAFLAICIHELGHVCEDAVYWESPRPMDDMPFESLAPATAAWSPTPSSVEDTMPAWLSHGIEFIRCALHLLHRCNELCYWLGIDALSIAGPRYGLSSQAAYQIALGDEPTRLAGVPFAEILSTPPAEPFIQLWREDTA